MKSLERSATALLAFALAATASALPSEWQYQQAFDVPAAGLIKVSLPVETLNTARPALEDLRLYDEAGNEVPYLVERPAPTPKLVRSARAFHVSLNPSNTVITLETGMTQPLEGVTLETPADNFIKAMRIEGSADGENWQPIAQGEPVFRQVYGASRLYIPFAAGIWQRLRLTIDDVRSQPVPFTGARLHAAFADPAPVEISPATISERTENPGETRLALDLGAANLDVAAVRIKTDEPLFTRHVIVAVPQVNDDSVREQTIGQGSIYRVAVEGLTPADNLSVPLETIVRSPEMILLIRNGDSPPLKITSVNILYRPGHLVFFARRPGSFRLLTGNSRCGPPRYDIAALDLDAKSIPVSAVKMSAPAVNPDYRVPEVLSGIGDTGAPLDVTAWKFRKPVKIARAGVQQLELDPDALAHSQPALADLRLMHGSNQVPYIIQRTSISRTLPLDVTVTNDPRNPKASHWRIRLPRAGLPLSRLTCTSGTALFDRSMTLSESLTDNRGERYRHFLGSANWTQTPDRKAKEFSISFNDLPQSDTLFLETENGDNPAIRLEKFTAIYPVTRLLFKTKDDDGLFLYYGAPAAAPPRYDLNLVAGQLLAADKKPVSLSDEQQLRQGSWRETQVPGRGGILFWGILALVVIVLLAVISRLLPKSQP